MTSASRGSPADGGTAPASVRGLASPMALVWQPERRPLAALFGDWWAHSPDRFIRGNERTGRGGFRASPFLSGTIRPSFMGLVVKRNPVCLNCLLCPTGKLSLPHAVGTAPGQRVPGAGRSLPVHLASPPPSTHSPERDPDVGPSSLLQVCRGCHFSRGRGDSLRRACRLASPLRVLRGLRWLVRRQFRR